MELPQMTVSHLLNELKKWPGEQTVKIWLPGSTIALAGMFGKDGMVMIEGNLEDGSALERKTRDG